MPLSAEANRRHALEYYWKHRDAMLVKAKRFRATHREWFANYMREYGKRNRARLSRLNRDYRRRNRERLNRLARERTQLKRLLRGEPPRRPPMTDDERRARHRLYYAANRDRLNAAKRAAYQLNKEKEHERGKLYRKRNRAILRLRGVARYWRNRDKCREWARQSYQRHKTTRAARQRIYRASSVHRRDRLAAKRRYYRNLPVVREKRRLRQLRRKRMWHRNHTKRLSGWYVRQLLSHGTNLRPEDFSPEIVRLQRMKLRLLRAAKETR